MEPRKKELSALPIMLNHKGFGCKIYALEGVLNWLHETKQIDTPPAPAQKRENKGYKEHSLRWHLKHEFNSAVGEVHNVLDLALLAEKHSEVVAYFAECKDETEYFKALIAAIDQGMAPIVFFDKDYESDDLAKLNGKMEHAAILAGYFFDEENVLFFKLAQFGKYVNVNAKELFSSADQLPKMRLIQENYFKLNQKDEGVWISESYAKKKKWDNFLGRRKESSPTKCNGFNKKILIVDCKVNPKIKLADMPVKFERPTSFTADFFEGLACKTNDTGADKEWDEKIKANRMKSFKCS